MSSAMTEHTHRKGLTDDIFFCAVDECQPEASFKADPTLSADECTFESGDILRFVLLFIRRVSHLLVVDET